MRIRYNLPILLWHFTPHMMYSQHVMKLQHTLLAPSLAVAFAAFACAQTPKLPDAPAAIAAALTAPNGPSVVMETSMGRITCQFYQRQAPKAVANFIALAEGTKDWTDPTT